MQMDIHETLYPFWITMKMPYFTETIKKLRFVDSNAFFSLMLRITQYKTKSFPAIISHCLAAGPQLGEQPANCPSQNFQKYFDSAKILWVVR